MPTRPALPWPAVAGLAAVLGVVAAVEGWGSGWVLGLWGGAAVVGGLWFVAGWTAPCTSCRTRFRPK